MASSLTNDPVTLGYVGLNTTQPQEWPAFCVDLLGLEPGTPSAGGAARYKMDQRSYRIAVQESTTDGLAYAGWEARSLAALERIGQAVEAAGAKVTEADTELLAERSVSALLSFTDPSGVRTEVFTGIRVEEEKPFMSPHGVEFVTGDQGLGHINLLVDNYQETFDFYAKVLGFGISDFRPSGPQTGIAFFGCDPRHHSYGIVDSHDRGTFLDHVMVEVQDFTNVGRAYDKVFDGAAQLSLTMGKHWNDQMTSFYVETPSGFDFEYGWGGRTVDRSTWTTVQFNSAAIWGHRAASKKAAARVAAKTWIDMDNIRGLGADGAE